MMLFFLGSCLITVLLLCLLGWSISRLVHEAASERRKGWMGLAFLGGIVLLGWPLVKEMVPLALSPFNR